MSRFEINAIYSIFGCIPVFLTTGWLSSILLGLQLGMLLFQGLSSNIPFTRTLLIICAVSLMGIYLLANPLNITIFCSGVIIAALANFVLIDIGVM